MTSIQDLATRALQKAKVIGATEIPDDADLDKAVEKVKAAHYFIDANGWTRWTLRNIPPQVEEPYVAMAAFLAAPDFVVPQDPNWWTGGVAQVQAFIQVPWSSVDTVRAEQL